MRDVLERLLSGQNLLPAQADLIFQQMLDGKLHDAQIGAILGAWRLQREGATELYAGAKSMRLHAAKVELSANVRPLVDNCGTGGDGSGSFNVSTAAAIVTASAGMRVAKHGNRSVSSKCGSADLLFAAGFPDDLSPKAAALLLERTGFTFFFAPNYHPALKCVADVRKALGIRTIFNLLGPLANPIAPEYQVIGVGAKAYLSPMAQTLTRLGVTRALIVHSQDGLDELSTAAPSDAMMVRGTDVSSLVIDPKDYGIHGTLAAVQGGDVTQNLTLLTKILDADPAEAALSEVVALNAAAVLWTAEVVPDIAGGLALARKQLESKAAKTFFSRWLTEAKALGRGGV